MLPWDTLLDPLHHVLENGISLLPVTGQASHMDLDGGTSNGVEGLKTVICGRKPEDYYITTLLHGPTSSSCGGLQPRFFGALQAKKELITL